MSLFDRFVWAMAWRDSRRARGRLLFYVSCLCVGVAALVAIGSFGENLRAAVAEQSKSMLGADLRIRSNQAWDDEVTARIERELVDGLGAEVSTQIGFASMAAFPGADAIRLVQVRALDGDYPYYGALETDPPGGAAALRSGEGALVDATLLRQTGATVGDEIKIGRNAYTIAGALTKIPGASATSALFGPRVYISHGSVDDALMQRGSRVRHDKYFRLAPSVDVDALRDEWRPFAKEHRLRMSTVESTQENLSESMDDLTGFLNLVGFVALLLGGLGVASAISVHVRAKTAEVATLRCIGVPAGRAFSIWLAQALVLGLIGAVVGGGLGVAVQRLLPIVLGDFLPMEVPIFVSWRAVAFGGLVAVVVSTAFALLPLLPLRRIPPLMALRADVEPPPAHRDPARFLAIGGILVAVLLFAWDQTGGLLSAAIYTGSLVGAYLLLAGTAWLLRRGVRRVFARALPWEWRQGLLNLDRPANQTGLLLVSIGLGTFLVLTLFQVRALLLAELDTVTEGERPNLVLFDVQDDQVESVHAVLAEHGATPQETVPIVTMRLKSVKGRSVRELRDDDTVATPDWVLRREYRSTFRDALSNLETLEEGTFVGAAPAEGPAPVSLERRIVDDLGVTIGDELVWDVQGVEIPTVVGSVRKVDWRQMRPNFFAVFPEGVLEEAPKFWVVVTHGEGPEQIGAIERALVDAHPNVSAIDVTLVLNVVDELLERVSFVIRFMAGFSVLTGLLVLAASILTGRYRRMEESVLLRALGATRGRVARILDVEVALIGLLAAVTGVVLAAAGTWALAIHRFEVDFALDTTANVAALVLVPLLTLLLGRLASRGLADAPPLEVLRDE